MSQTADDFYIGYEDRMPSSIARLIRGTVAFFAFSAVAVIAVVVFMQRKLPAALFEFGVLTAMRGDLRREPYPSLTAGDRRIWLVAPGKFGAERVLGGAIDGPATVEGSAIARSGNRMLELRSVSVDSESTPNSSRDDSESRRLTVTLTGEIVDTKCFLGVMNPNEGTVHRDCARRCLSGGIPPMLLVRDGAYREQLVVLVSASGGPLSDAVAGIAGRPITVTGDLVRAGNDYVLYADSQSFVPISRARTGRRTRSRW